jgi:hypothetical protein
MFPEARVRDPRPHMTLFVMSVIAVIALLSFSIGELTERPFSGPEAEILAEPDVQHCDGVIRAIFSVSHPLSPTQEKVWKQTIEAWEKKQPGDVIRHVEIYQGRSRHVIITVMDAI